MHRYAVVLAVKSWLELTVAVCTLTGLKRITVNARLPTEQLLSVATDARLADVLSTLLAQREDKTLTKVMLRHEVEDGETSTADVFVSVEGRRYISLSRLLFCSLIENVPFTLSGRGNQMQLISPAGGRVTVQPLLRPSSSNRPIRAFPLLCSRKTLLLEESSAVLSAHERRHTITHREFVRFSRAEKGRLNRRKKEASLSLTQKH